MSWDPLTPSEIKLCEYYIIIQKHIAKCWTAFYKTTIKILRTRDKRQKLSALTPHSKVSNKMLFYLTQSL